MRTTLYPLVDSLEAAIDLPEPIVEFGSLRVEEQSHLQLLKDRFPGKRYIGTDFRPGSGVDQVQDLHSLGLADGSVGTALMLDTIEHVREPWAAMREIHRCLKPGGLVLMTSVFFFPIHAFPDDYWRFTASAIDVLLQDFDLIHSGMAGQTDLPHTVLGIGAKEPFDAEKWSRAVTAADAWLEGGATSWKERALVAFPPVVLVAGYDGFRAATSLYSRLRKRDHTSRSDGH
ncbi:MAG TPA: class I SAM-dependent methyltransferase [Acidimicrobiales bacterium]|nr:class I SAM-dependent methyltransferase [Acidimicrobiales bacterium]